MMASEWMPADGAAACKHQMVNVEQRPKFTSIWLAESVMGRFTVSACGTALEGRNYHIS